MAAIIIFVIIAYFVGLIISRYFVFPLRAGAPVELRGWRGERITLNRNNIEWLFVTAVKTLVWPALLVYWLLQGMPQSPWKVVRKMKVDGRVVMLVRRVGEKAEGETETSDQ